MLGEITPISVTVRDDASGMPEADQDMTEENESVGEDLNATQLVIQPELVLRSD